MELFWTDSGRAWRGCGGTDHARLARSDTGRVAIRRTPRAPSVRTRPSSSGSPTARGDQRASGSVASRRHVVKDPDKLVTTRLQR
jgi:hypothetical protein